MGEFDLIARYFTRPCRDAALGVGDDCALLGALPTGMQWAISTDMLVSDRHFWADVEPQALGHKALAVNLSDLAAMGARPRAFTLAMALPEINEPWLAGFAQGIWALADEHGCELIGGDTTRGPLNICITVFGEVPTLQALRRDAAQANDDVWVSGTLGDAAWALSLMQSSQPLPAEARSRLERPTPRIELGLRLRGLAHACMDLSDGLGGDLKHLLQASGVGAAIELSQLPTSPSLQILPAELRRNLALSGGDDYELLFTAAPNKREALQVLAADLGVPLTRIGTITRKPGLVFLDHGTPVPAEFGGYDHFSI